MLRCWPELRHAEWGGAIIAILELAKSLCVFVTQLINPKVTGLVVVLCC